MAGIYIHIPYCKQACHYCDFHFSTNHSNRAEMVKAMQTEIASKGSYLENKIIETIYFGGGTPSVLDQRELESLLSTLYENFSISDNPEITLEGNPDDLNEEKLKELKSVGVNRLSVGIQTFDGPTLISLNRAHNDHEAKKCLHNIHWAGFDNFTIDLMFALPPEMDSFHRFKRDLDIALTYLPPHISLYGLTIEDRTVFGHQFSKNKLIPVREETNAAQYEYAIETLTMAGFDHYEVSNFCLPDKLSRHNSSYWNGIPYLGIGPGAHSFNGNARSFNVRNNAKYIKSIKDELLPAEVELLSDTQKLNEYLLTGTRTKWGVNLELLKANWDFDLLKKHEKFIQGLIDSGHAKLAQDSLRLTSKGFSIADEVALRFFEEE